MRLRFVRNKTAFLIPYLALVVLLPCSRGDRLQKYHFFQLTASDNHCPSHSYPAIDNVTDGSHLHVPLHFYPAGGHPKSTNYFSPLLTHSIPEPELHVLMPSWQTSVVAFTGAGPPSFCYTRTVSGLSPPVNTVA
ncbi:MAG: hypothetical protein M1508_11635 [Nitrospirae bacterium]|nr:hypothetical protein [Nitrospirota bacterium]MCL5421003.1 hypothetical protein [Nitrospirota bacterium]